MFAAGAVSAVASDTASLKKAASGLRSLRLSRVQCKHIKNHQDGKRFHAAHHNTPVKLANLSSHLAGVVTTNNAPYQDF